MLPIERTFRIVPTKSIARLLRRRTETDTETSDFTQLTASPFENPSKLLHIGGSSGIPATDRECDLARAAYFATFPAVD